MRLSLNELVAIESKAFELVKQNHISLPEVNVDKIATSLGLQIIPYDLNEISGALIIENNKGFIGFNPSHSTVRKRFTIAHEVGHFHLHCHSGKDAKRKDQLFVDKDFIVKYRNANSYTYAELKQEQEANAFAAALLMPREFIQKELNKPSNKIIGENELIEHLANRFKVSIPAMTFRLDNLSSYFYSSQTHKTILSRHLDEFDAKKESYAMEELISEIVVLICVTSLIY